MRAKIESSLSTSIPAPIVKALLDAYFELKENFYLSKFRPSELEAGRFSEAAIRAVQHLGTGTHDDINKPLPRFDILIRNLENLPSQGIHESIRIHIPRALWSVYTVRNRRNVGHIGGDVDPNNADAHLVMAVCDWVLAELMRITFACSLAEAQAIADNLVERKIPLIQEFSGFPKIVKAGLSIPEKIMVIAYAAGAKGFVTTDVYRWLKSDKKSAINVALSRLENDKLYIHRDSTHCYITIPGSKYVETSHLIKS